MKKSLLTLSLISTIAVLGLNACGKKTHDSHMPSASKICAPLSKLSLRPLVPLITKQ